MFESVRMDMNYVGWFENDDFCNLKNITYGKYRSLKIKIILYMGIFYINDVSQSSIGNKVSNIFLIFLMLNGHL